MKLPKATQLPSGNWRVQLQLGGERISLTGADRKSLEREAAYLKAEYKAGHRDPAPEMKQESEGPDPAAAAVTVSQCFDAYLSPRGHSLSPLTIRFYRSVQKNRFASVMSRHVDDIASDEWQGLVDAEAATVAPKTLLNAYSAMKTVVRAVCGVALPTVTLPGSASRERAFLSSAEIPLFVAAVKDSPYALPLLLALSSMRISEINALRWENIPKDPDFIWARGAVVLNEKNEYIEKNQNKNETSQRPVPILIPELKAALERDRKENGPVMPCSQNNLRLACHRICKQAGVTDVTVHGLRHSFASLCYHLRVPEKIAQDIGGWKDAATMHKIYTHIAQLDINRYKSELAAFYSKEKK